MIDVVLVYIYRKADGQLVHCQLAYHFFYNNTWRRHFEP